MPFRFVPSQKLSLGIAAYGFHWYTGDPGVNKKDKASNVTADSISQPTAGFAQGPLTLSLAIDHVADAHRGYKLRANSKISIIVLTK